MTSSSRRVPLAWSQLAHWRLHQPAERAGTRNVACATQLSGPLDLKALRSSLAAMVDRHDALRTRFVVVDGTPLQEIYTPGDLDFQIHDLAALPEKDRETAVRRQLQQLILQPVDVSRGPLFGVRVLKLAQTEHVLVLALEHMVSDAVSLQILLQETLEFYRSTTTGQTIELPPVQLQFPDYALRQRGDESTWVKAHSRWWSHHFRGCERLRFPEPRTGPHGSGWGMVPLRIGTDLKRQLQERCKRERASPALVGLTAYAAVVLRWCEAVEAVIRYQGNGRTLPEMQTSVGFYASRLYLRVRLRETDRFADLLARVTMEFCDAYEHDDFSYLEAQPATPEFASSTFFNWIPWSPGSLNAITDSSGHGLATRSIPFVNPWYESLVWDNEPMTLLFDTGDEVCGGVYFSRRQLSVETMERFARAFITTLEMLARQSELAVRDIPVA